MGRIVEKLGGLGVKGRVEDIERWSGGKTIGRPHVARAILAWWQGSADPACYAAETAAPLAGRAGMA